MEYMMLRMLVAELRFSEEMGGKGKGNGKGKGKGKGEEETKGKKRG